MFLFGQSSFMIIPPEFAGVRLLPKQAAQREEMLCTAERWIHPKFAAAQINRFKVPPELS